MIRVVLDTNVLVSAILTSGGPSHRVMELVLRGDLQLCVDSRIEEEYREVLARGKFSFPEREVGLLLEALLGNAQKVLAPGLPGHLPDETDRAFLEVAAAGAVEALITGNTRHYKSAASFGIRVMNPGQFLQRYQ